MAEPLQEIHGLARVIKCAIVDDTRHGQDVTVTDDGRYVRLELSTSSYPARLTVKEARYLAQRLMQSASRVDQTETEDAEGA